MKLVVDANILISALIKQSFTAHLLAHKELDLHMPVYCLIEIEKHRSYIMSKSNMDSIEFAMFLQKLMQRIQVHQIMRDEQDAALPLASDINDVAYIALAKKLSCPIWSEDRKMTVHIKVLRTLDVVNLLTNSS